MERKTSKKVAEPLADGLFREVTIELIQHYHDSTKKLIKTEEGARIEGRLFRVVKQGEKAETQLMNSVTYEVVSLIEDHGLSPLKKAKKPKPKVEAVNPPSPPVSAPKTKVKVVVAGAFAAQALVAQAAQSIQEAEDETVLETLIAQAEGADVLLDEALDPESEIVQSEDVAAAALLDNQLGETDMSKSKNAAPKKVPKAKAEKAPKAPKAPKVKAEKAPKAPKAVKEPKAPKEKKAPAAVKPVDLSKRKLNAKELKLFTALNAGSGPKNLADLATAAFAGKPSIAKANSWTRNSLRRLVRAELVEQLARGVYGLTTKGKHYNPAKA